MHHDRCVPPDVSADSSLEEFIPRECRFLIGWNGVHVIGDSKIGKRDVLLVGSLEKREHQITGAITASVGDQRVEGLVPFGRLIGVGVDELRDVEVLDRICLAGVHVHTPIFPFTRPLSEFGACDPGQELRDALSKCGLLPS